MKRIILKTVHIIKGTFIILFALLLIIPSKLILCRKKVWLISERPNEARDNGYVFYSFLVRTHPEINAFYLISKTSPDLNKIRKINGKYIKFGSFKHYFYFAGCKYSISSTVEWLAPNSYLLLFQNKIGFPHKNIFLQHGIIDTNMDFLHKKFNNLHLFICGAEPEYNDVLLNYGYGDGTAYTGLARFDNYLDLKLKKQILVMPTWRRGADDIDIKKSDYFKYWTSFLNNKTLFELLERSGVRLYFYIHPVFQKYINYFKSNSENVFIADFAHYDVQKLLMESKLLITDYSSVLFDFAFMKKPTLYYQFDRESYYMSHYKKGYFSYDKDAFGYVCLNEKNLINKIEDSMTNDFVFPKEFIKNFERFFVLHDADNCKRIYEAIIKL